MLIDVIDLKIQKLQFNRSYNPSRHNRGMQIYRQGLASIELVDEVGCVNIL